MSFSAVLSFANELVNDKKYTEAVSELEKLRITQLTYEELDAASALFARLPVEISSLSAAHCLQEMTVYAEIGEFPLINEWFSRMVSLRERYKEGTPARAALEDYICLANMLRPGCDNARMLLMLAVLYHEGRGSSIPVVVDATGGSPSVLHGSNDLSEWSQTCGAVISIAKPMLSVLFGEGGLSFLGCFKAEVLLERCDYSGALQAIAGSLSFNSPELFFASHAILARIKLLQPGGQYPDDVLDSIGAMIEERDAAWLLPNYHALRAQFSLLSDKAYAAEWLKTEAPDELSGITPNRFFCAKAKARTYLALGRFSDAMTLSQLLISSIKGNPRPFDTADCMALDAVSCFLAGDDASAIDLIAKALDITTPYGYINVYACYGSPLVQLVEKYIAERAPEGLYLRYAQRVLAAAEDFSARFPSLYGFAGEKKATESAPAQASEPESTPAQASEPESAPVDQPAPEKENKPKSKKRR